MTSQLPPDVQAIVKAKLASGEFSSEEDVLAAGVRLLQHEDEERARQRNKLRGMLQEAIDEMDRGEFQDVDEAFDEVEIELFGKKLADS